MFAFAGGPGAEALEHKDVLLAHCMKREADGNLPTARGLCHTFTGQRGRFSCYLRAEPAPTGWFLFGGRMSPGSGIRKSGFKSQLYHFLKKQTFFYTLSLKLLNL